MDDAKAKLMEATKDMTVTEIATAISNSRHATTVYDPLAVAALIKSWG